MTYYFASMSLFIPLVAFAFLLTLSTSSLDNNNNNVDNRGGFKAMLYHADHDKSLTKTELFQRSLQRESERKAKRQAMMAQLAAAGPSPSQGFRIAPVTGDYGEFFVNLYIGTPPLLQRVRVDTDSDLIWTPQCANSSSSYSALPCSSDLCKAEPKLTTCDKYGSCVFKYEYTIGSTVQVDLHTETFTFGGNVTLPNITFGCDFLKTGGFQSEEAGGLGLGSGSLSLISQLNATNLTYCLPSFDYPDKTGVVLVGSSTPVKTLGSKVITTSLITNPFKPSPYYIPLKGISVGGVILPIPVSTFAIDGRDGSGGVVLDTGSTLTYLKQSVFDKVTQEVKKQIKISTFNSSEDGLSLCFSVPSRRSKTFVFPRITLHFDKDNHLELSTGNSYREHTDESTNKTISCLMMAAAPPSDLGLTSLGNIQQQNTLVAFDLVKKTVEFRPNTPCDKI